MEQTKYNMSDSDDYNEIYSQEKVVNVPFSWEYKPGLSKVNHHHQLSNNDARSSNLVLRPPPYRRTSGGNNTKVRDDEDTWGPFICSAQPSSLRISSFRMETTPKEEDPFVEAYKKCSKSPAPLKRSREVQRNNGSWPGIMTKYMHILSCKYSGDVVSMV